MLPPDPAAGAASGPPELLLAANRCEGESPAGHGDACLADGEGPVPYGDRASASSLLWLSEPVWATATALASHDDRILERLPDKATGREAPAACSGARVTTRLLASGSRACAYCLAYAGVGGAVVGHMAEVLGGFRVVAQDGRHDRCGLALHSPQPGSDLLLGAPLVPGAVPDAHSVGGFLQQIPVAVAGGVGADALKPDHDRCGVAELHHVRVVSVHVLGQGAQEGVSLRPTKSRVSAVALSPRRSTLAAVGSVSFDSPWVGLWDIRDPQHPVRTRLLDPYEPRERASASADPGPGPSPLPTLPFLGDTPAVFGPDGTTLALPDVLWDVTNPSAPIRLATRRTSDLDSMLHERYSFAAFRADGRELVTSDRGDLSVWSVNRRNGRRFLSAAQVSDRLSQIDFHPGGHLVATGSSAGRAGLWAAGGSRPLTWATALTDTTAEVADVRFSRDRKTLAVTLDSGTVELWNLGDLPAIAAAPTTVACGITGTGLSRKEWRQYAPGLPYEPTCPQR